jgi:hypothetical protein
MARHSTSGARSSRSRSSRDKAGLPSPVAPVERVGRTAHSVRQVLTAYTVRKLPAPLSIAMFLKGEGGFLDRITDAAAQFADPGYEAHLRKRRRGGARLWKHVARHLSDLTFRLLHRGVDCFTIRVAAGVL